MGTYIPGTPEERSLMMKAVGINQLSELFGDVPKELMLEKLTYPRACRNLRLLPR